MSRPANVRCVSSTHARSALLGGALLLGLAPGCRGEACETRTELLVTFDDSIVPVTLDLRAIVRSSSAVVVVGSEGRIARRSSVGGWVAIESPTVAELRGVDAFGSRMLAVGSGAAVVLSEDEGITWTLVDAELTGDLDDVYIDEAVAVLVGQGIAATSADGGLTWQPSVLPSAELSLHGVSSDGASLWAVGADGVILTSVDEGASWTELASPTTADLWAVGPAGSERDAGLFAVGEGGTILRLVDDQWVTVDHGISAAFRGVGGNFVVGDEGVIVAVAFEEQPGGELQSMVELDRDLARGDLWDVAGEIAVGDGGRATTIGLSFIEDSPGPYCEGVAKP